MKNELKNLENILREGKLLLVCNVRNCRKLVQHFDFNKVNVYEAINDDLELIYKMYGKSDIDIKSLMLNLHYAVINDVFRVVMDYYTDGLLKNYAERDEILEEVKKVSIAKEFIDTTHLHF